jgi:deoxycytidylate deaminase
MSKYNETWALSKALEASLNSPCKSKRGVVIWDREFGLISTGYNAPPNPKNCDCSDACKLNCSKTAVHAEQLAILNIKDTLSKYNNPEMLHVKSVDGKPVFSDKPSCHECSKLLLKVGIKYMWLYRAEGFTKYDSKEFHRQTLINCNLVRENDPIMLEQTELTVIIPHPEPVSVKSKR